MSDLEGLSALIKKRNTLEREIARIIGRPGLPGHIGEYIAARIFSIELEESASRRSIDGRFRDGALAGKTVNIKWYAKQDGLLDITPAALPDYYLLLAGPRSAPMGSRGGTRPLSIDLVYLFDARVLIDELMSHGVKIGIATSVRTRYWEAAEIFPRQNNSLLILTEGQKDQIRLFAGGTE